MSFFLTNQRFRREESLFLGSGTHRPFNLAILPAALEQEIPAKSQSTLLGWKGGKEKTEKVLRCGLGRNKGS